MKRTIFTAHSKIRNFLLLFIVIAVTFFVLLRGGISISHLKIASFTLDGLYLKLNKKLILKVDKIIIPHTKKQNSIPNFEKDLDNTKRILKFFEYIQLKEIRFKNENYSLLFSDKIIYMTSDEYEIAAHQLNRVGDKLQAIIDLFYIKNYDLHISGKLIYNYKDDRALLHGDIQYSDIKSNFVINKQKNRFYYVLKSNKFKDLKSLIDQFELPTTISAWITDKVKASVYELESFKGIGSIDNESVSLLPETIIATAKLQEATIKFHDDLNPVKTKMTTLQFNHGNLYFQLHNPHYLDKNLSGSKASIVGLTDMKAPILNLNLMTDTTLDKDIHTLLNTYNITLPIKQKGDRIKSKFNLDINLKNKKVNYSGEFKVANSTMTIADLKLPVKKGVVSLKNNQIKLKKIELHNDQYNASVDGTINIQNKRANFIADVKNFQLGQYNNLPVSFKKRKIALKIDYNDGTTISLPSLGATLNIPDTNSSSTISLENLQKIKNAFTNFATAIDGGHLAIQTKEFKSYSFKGTLKRNECFFYNKESECLTQIPVNGSYQNDHLRVRAFDDRLNFDAKNSLITIKNINFDLRKYLQINSEKNDDSTLSKKIKIVATNSTVRYENYKLLTDKYEIGILPNNNFHFRGTLDRDIITVTKREKRLEIVANRIKDKMLHPLINFDGLQKGRYSVKIEGIPGKSIKGVVRLDGGVMSNFKAYNNTLALINTLPALATLHSPGFNKEGFKIKQGLVKFTILNSEKLIFDSILIEGESATISGDGVIDLKTEKIDVDLAIQTAKPMGKLIRKIPIVGYILIGNDGSLITAGLHIGGTLKKPEPKTSPVKDILSLPFKMIERTFAGNSSKK